MEIIVSSDESITCDLIDKDRSIWSCNLVGHDGVIKKSIGTVHDWIVGDGVMSEVIDSLYEKYKISGLNAGMHCIVEEKDGTKKMIINCKNY